MSSTAATLGASSAAASKDEAQSGTGAWFKILLSVIVASVVSGFFAINEYASGTAAIIKSANNNSARFEAIFKDLVQARYRALNLGAETLLQSRVTVEAFAKEDRAALTGRIEPFYENLKKYHGIEQINFWQAPAKIFYRAGSPNEFGMDLSKFRKSVVAATERRARISAIETGLGGLIGIRGMVPVMVDDKFIGVIEYVSNFDIPLERASETSGLKWGVSLMKDVSERVERPVDAKNDAWQGTDVYFRFSDAGTGQIIRNIKFDPRATSHTLAESDGKTVFVKTFPVVNFSGVPTITVATVLDVTQPFAEVFKSVAIKTIIIFLAIAILGSVAFIKFAQIKAQFGAALGRQKKELEERSAACDAALARLRDVDVVKRGFFTNLVTAINEPLQSVAGQLQSLPKLDPSLAGNKEINERLQFALAETSRLSQLVGDYQQLEMFRQKLVKKDAPSVTLADVVSRTIEDDLEVFRRLPQLNISGAVATDLPPTRADADLLRRAIAGLVGYAARRTGQGRIVLGGSVNDANWLVLSITGSAFTGAGAPTEALLDESRQFMSRLAAGATPDNSGGVLLNVVLARVIVEFYGGSLDMSYSKDAPGFIIKLPTAA
jgi:Double sensory domain of two-component sensor kinase